MDDYFRRSARSYAHGSIIGCRRFFRAILPILFIGALVPSAALAHKDPETGAPAGSLESTGFTTPAAMNGKTFVNPKMHVYLQDNYPTKFAYDTGDTYTTGYIQWDLQVSPAGNCSSMPQTQIEIQRRDLDSNGAALTPWRTSNYVTQQSACSLGSGAEAYHWGPDSIGAVHQGGSNFEMRLRDSVSGAIYLTAGGPGSFIRPLAPTNLLITDITTTSVTIEWLNNARYANEFEIERRVDPGGTWIKVATPKNSVSKGQLARYTDSTVSSGVEYTYRVRAKNGLVVSDWTNEAATQAGIIDRERAFGSSLGVNPTGELGDPVNTLTGAFVTNVTDLTLPGVGIPFVFERSYNSADTAAGALGIGWSHPFETSLSFPNSTKVKVRGSDGQRMTFTKQADGTYKGEVGARVNLVAVPGAYEVRHFDGSLERYDTYGQLYQVKDQNGNKLTMTAREGAGHVTSITDSVGRVIALAYNSSHLLSSVTLPDGRSIRYAYTPNGLLQTVTDVRGGNMTYSYDDAKRLTKIVDQNGNALVTSAYNAKGRVTQQLDARGNQWLYDWNAHTQTATVTDPRGNAYKDVYKGNVLRRRIDPLGNVTGFDYDGDLNVVAVTDPRSKTTTMTYDSRGNILTRTAPAPLSYQEQWTYNAQNRPLSYTNGRGRTTTFQYDSKGNLDLVEQPGNVVTDYMRDPTTGVLLSVVDPRSKTTRFTYDAQGNLIEAQMPGGGVARYVHDSSGRVTGIIDPRGTVVGANANDYKTTLAYNAANQVTSLTDPLGNSTATAYDAGGRATSVTNAKNRSTSYSYNSANLLTSVTAPDNSVTAYAYDSAGNLTSRTDAKNHTTSYVYDEMNRLIRTTSPTGQRWDYDYDAASNLIRMTDAVGNSTAASGDGVTSYTYDGANRVAVIDYSDSTPDVSFVYDGNGNVVSMGDGAGTEVYTYDDLDRLTKVTRGSDVFSYEYDKTANVTRRTYPDGTISDLTYDDDSRLTSVTTGGRATSYSYDPAGLLTSTTFPAANGHVETRTYDRAGNLSSIVTARGSNVLTEATYVRDAVGIRSASRRRPGAKGTSTTCSSG